MQFDIIDITPEEIEKLSVVQMKMLRTAQQKKDELFRKADKDISMFRAIVMTAGMKNSTLLDAKKEPLLKLNQQSPVGKIDLDAKNRYYLYWKFKRATGKCELRW